MKGGWEVEILFALTFVAITLALICFFTGHPGLYALSVLVALLSLGYAQHRRGKLRRRR